MLLQYNELAAGSSGGSHNNLGLKIGLPVALGSVLALLLCCCCFFGCRVSTLAHLHIPDTYGTVTGFDLEVLS